MSPGPGGQARAPCARPPCSGLRCAPARGDEDAAPLGAGAPRLLRGHGGPLPPPHRRHIMGALAPISLHPLALDDGGVMADKTADLAGPGISTYPEVKKILPDGYRSL